MKTFIILFMATTAINAFFIGERSRDDFIDGLHKFFLNFNSQMQLPHMPPSGLTEVQRIRNRIESLSPEEQETLKNHLFGERFPRPMPAHHIENIRSEFSEENMKEKRENWAAMTPEEREEHHQKLKREHSKLNHHFVGVHPEFSEENMKEKREKWEAMTPEEREEHHQKLKREHSKLNHHFVGVHPEFSEENMKEKREKWETMTPEEREEHHRNHRKEHEGFLIRSPRSIRSQPENNRHNRLPLNPNGEEELIRSPRMFQSIRPLPELIPQPSDNGRTRINDPLTRERRPVAIRPSSEHIENRDESELNDIFEVIEDMTPEERAQYLQQVFPDGIPIRPIGIVPAGQKIQPEFRLTDEKKTLDEIYANFVPIIASNDDGRTRIVDPMDRVRRPEINNNQVPLMRPVPLHNMNENMWNQKPQTRPEWNKPQVRPAQFQPILPFKFQPIMPLPEYNRPNRPAFI